ncbi:MAG: thrombospondin type 3 repeat-containing protein, partial [Anaerolineae bacterium]|nr:thrombospondin type 3 repeat-containing protein [Anaerolineae bacterium]
MKSARALLFTVPLLVVALVAGSFTLALSSAGPSAPDNVLADALKLAGRQSGYHLMADVQQTVIPRALPGNGGKGDETTSVRVVGDLANGQGTGANERRARLQFFAGAEQPVELILTADKAFIGYGQRWQQVDAPPGGVAPGGDYLGYLVAATDIAEGEPVVTQAGAFRRYTFTFDGQRYAEYQRDEAYRMLASQLPQGMQLELHPVLKATTGSGELWVDSDGLPRREVLNLAMPGVTAGYDAQMQLTVDFSGYGDSLPAIALPQPTGPDGALVLPAADPAAAATTQSRAPLDATMQPAVVTQIGEALANAARPLRRPISLALAMLPALALLALLFGKQRRSFYVAVVSALILVMVSQPLLEAGKVVRFASRSAEAAPLADAFEAVGALPKRNASLQGQLAPLGTREQDPVLRDCRALYTDSGYAASGDEDADGLDNATEWCLGTDFRNADSDRDTITDTLEVEGFVYNNQTWTTDPLQSDSNRDGMTDGNEWRTGLSPEEFAAFIDFDGDGVPNPWDDDNDGDGVPDSLDISPYSVQAYRTGFDVEVTSHTTDTNVYLDVQVQPQDASHLRYALSTLDWPADDKGQIQDLNDAPGDEDITLLPFLDVHSTISPALAMEYGIVAQDVDPSDVNSGYSLMVPLQPVLNSGNVLAFSSHVAFTSAEAAEGISLTGARVVWLAPAALDQYVTSCQEGDPDCACNDNGSCVLTQNSVVAVFPENAVRVTGLQVSASADAQVGLFGSNAPAISTDPAVDDEDKVMMTLMSAGLAGSFLDYVNPDLNQIAVNFQDPSAQPPYTPTWSINPAVMQVVTDTYPHRDEAIATTTQTTTVQFLDGNYQDCTVNSTAQVTPTLAMAYQETFGFMDVTDPRMTVTNGDPAVQSSAPVQFSVPLADAALGVLRQVQLNSYACDIGDDGEAGWRPLSEAEAINELNRRYADDLDQPWFGAMQQVVATYDAGMDNIISIDGGLVNGTGLTAPDDAYVQFTNCQANNMPDCVRTEYQLDSLVLNVDTLGTVNGYWDWASGAAGFQTGIVYFDRLAYNLGRLVLSRWKTVEELSILTRSQAEIRGQDSPYRLNNLDDPYVEVGQNWRGDDIMGANPNYQSYEEKLAQADVDVGAEARATANAGVGKWSSGLAVGLTLVVLALIWLPYFGFASGEPSIQRDVSLANAIAATMLLGIQVLVDLIVIGVEYYFSAATSVTGGIVTLVVFLLIYIFIAAISGDWNPLKTTEELAKLILNVNVLAQIPDNGINTGPLNMRVEPGSSGASGAVAGQWYNITTTVSTTVQLNKTTQEESWYKDQDVGSSDDVKKSWAYARWSALSQSSPQYPTYLSQYLITNTL